MSLCNTVISTTNSYTLVIELKESCVLAKKNHIFHVVNFLFSTHLSAMDILQFWHLQSISYSFHLCFLHNLDFTEKNLLI